VPAIFRILQEGRRVPETEMYQVFNMGIGMVTIVSPNDAADLGKKIGAKQIGQIESGRGLVRLI